MESMKRIFPWPATPIPGISLSASGLLALADLSTVADRTVITGTSTWLDMFVLAPGLHNQQRADVLRDLPNIHPPPILTTPAQHPSSLTNIATIRYLARLGSATCPITLRVGPPQTKSLRKTVNKASLRRTREMPGPNLIASLLYGFALILTAGAMVIMVLTQDWWGVGILGALMVARALNIWIIRSRTAGDVTSSPPKPESPRLSADFENWTVKIDGDQDICLRGQAQDLKALTEGVWMREKTPVEGYVEAAAKLIVYLVATCSGNMHQTGNIVLLVLLLGSAGLLALSNTREDRFSMNGRSAVVMKTPINGEEAADWPTSDGDGKSARGRRTSGSVMTV